MFLCAIWPLWYSVHKKHFSDFLFKFSIKLNAFQLEISTCIFRQKYNKTSFITNVIVIQIYVVKTSRLFLHNSLATPFILEFSRSFKLLFGERLSFMRIFLYKNTQANLFNLVIPTISILSLSK